MEFKCKRAINENICLDFIPGPEPIKAVCGKSFCCDDSNEVICIILFDKQKIFACDGIKYKNRGKKK